MTVEFQRPLIRVDVDGEVRRVRFTEHDPSGVSTSKLRCPLSGQTCSVDCAAITLYERSDELGLACKAMPRTILLGLLDPDTIDYDLVQSLRHATDLSRNRAVK